MILISDIIKSFKDFPCIEQVKPEFLEKFGKERTLSFLKSLRSVPLTMGSIVPEPDKIGDEILRHLEKLLLLYTLPVVDAWSVVQRKEEPMSGCFLPYLGSLYSSLGYLGRFIESENKLLENETLCCGWSSSRIQDSIQWDTHFWVIDNQNSLIETTGTLKDCYIGRGLSAEDALKIMSSRLSRQGQCFTD